MAYLYSVPFHDYIYPPVDIDVFKPICDESREGYVMAIARNANEPGIKLLDMIAKHVPLVVVGGARVNGAKNLGSVSDDELSQLFAKASVTISSVVAEFFGYAVAESLACGTPVIAYDCCGPSELIKNSLNGWVVKSPSEMIDVVRSATSKRLTPEVSKSARDTAKLFSVQASAKRLVTIVQACEEGRHDRTASRLP
jgi:glycosyltransferase involved in cell wall biosynthesis